MRHLIDSATWLDAFKKHPVEKRLAPLMDVGVMYGHPLIHIELLQGGLPRKYAYLGEAYGSFKSLPIDMPGVLRFVRERRSDLVGLGAVDNCLLWAALSAKDATIWTRDKALLKAAKLCKIPTETY